MLIVVFAAAVAISLCASAMQAPSSKPAPTATKKEAADTGKAAGKTEVKKEAAPGGGEGRVWVNLDSGVYHSEGTRWYGKTKSGKYMTEAEAKKAGHKAAKEGAAGETKKK